MTLKDKADSIKIMNKIKQQKNILIAKQIILMKNQNILSKDILLIADTSLIRQKIK